MKGNKATCIRFFFSSSSFHFPLHRHPALIPTHYDQTQKPDISHGLSKPTPITLTPLFPSSALCLYLCTCLFIYRADVILQSM